MSLNINTGGGANKLPPRVLLLGVPKIGKTSFGAQAENAVFLPTENGCSQIDGLQYFPKATSWNEAIENVKALGTEDHDRKWLVVDTLDGLAELCCEDVMKNDFKNSPALFNNYKAGYDVAANQFKYFFTLIDRLREVKKMGIIMLCHVGTQSEKSPIGNDFSKYTGSIYKTMWAIPRNECDIIGLACHDFNVIGADPSKVQKGKAKASSDERFILFKGTPALDIGCRAGYEMPEKIRLDWGEFKTHLANSFGKKGTAK